MLEILAFVEAELARGAAAVELDVLDPDKGRGSYAGETVAISAAGETVSISAAEPTASTAAEPTAGTAAEPTAGAAAEPTAGTATERNASTSAPLIHRPWRTWLDLAERLGLRMCTPRAAAPPRLRLRFEPLDRSTLVRGGDAGTEKYGTQTDFARIHKLEDPGLVVDVRDAIERVVAARRAQIARGTDDRARDIPASPSDVTTHGRVLYLGCNTGDEIVLVRATSPALAGASHIGIDHSASAIAAARARFANEQNISFYEADLVTVAPALGRFDLIVSIGTLQSPGINDRELLRTLVQDHLAPHGAVLIGLPNCRYVDGEVEYGARMRNFRQPELGLVIKDIAFYRKYLQQHHKQVFVTGKHYLLVTAVHAAVE
jgi:trans-aconitate methyltransferase